jgi:Na+/melibiose symporter-like transporter
MQETSLSAGLHRPPLSTTALLLFAASAFPLQAILMAVSVYLPQYYARHTGLDLASVGAAFAFIRLIDLPIDPALGLFMDRTRTRWGRYRFWLILGAPITAAGVYMLFMADAGVGAPYVMFWLLVMYIGTSILTLSHSAWAALLSPSYNERSRMFGAIGAMGVAGMTLVFAVPLLAPAADGQSLGVPEMGWFILLSIPIAVFASCAFLPEPVVVQTSNSRASIKDYVALLTHPSMTRIVLSMLFFTIGTSWEGALFLFYFTEVRGFSVQEASLLLIAALGIGLLGAPAIGRLSTRIGKHRATIVTGLAYVGALASLVLVPMDAPLLSCVPLVCSGFLFAGFHVLLRSMTADVADEIRLTQDKERSGLLFSLITLAPKLSAAISVGLTFNVLAAIGYNPASDAENTAAAMSGLAAAYVLGPIGFVLLGTACMFGYKLGPARTAEIQRLLQLRTQQQSLQA